MKIKTNIQFVNSCKLKEILNEKNTLIIIDSKILNLYSNEFQQVNPRIIVIDDAEKTKNINNFLAVLEKLIEYKANKNTHLIGIGGGKITDLTGFIASIYMRGIAVSFIPTTLLAMVDASVGGKNALDFGNIKNIIGTIYQPQNIFINLDFLKSLPNSEIFSGIIEILKIGFLFDKSLAMQAFNTDFQCSNFKSQNQIEEINKIIQKSIEQKLKIVEEDEFDNGKRKLLNFGHTIGHILELEYNLPHGEAVAYGMIFEVKLATLLNYTNNAVFDEIHKIITKYFTKSLENFDLKSVIDKIIFDKKNICGKIALTIIKELGNSELIDVDIENFKKLMT